MEKTLKDYISDVVRLAIYKGLHSRLSYYKDVYDSAEGAERDLLPESSLDFVRLCMRCCKSMEGAARRRVGHGNRGCVSIKISCPVCSVETKVELEDVLEGFFQFECDNEWCLSSLLYDGGKISVLDVFD